MAIDFKSDHQENLHEQGFTLVELLWTMAIVGIITAMSWVSYRTYIERAEYARAEVTLRTLRPSLEAGEHQLPAGYEMGLTFTSSIGEPLEGDLRRLLPGASVSENIQLGVTYNHCAQDSPAGLVAAHMRAIPCNAGRYISWTRLCGGGQFFVHNVEHTTGCT